MTKANQKVANKMGDSVNVGNGNAVGYQRKYKFVTNRAPVLFQRNW